MTSSSRTTLRRVMESRPMWLALGLVIVALLVIGTHHPQAPSAQQRINNLEAIIKCPACATASLAQSETVGANDLKKTITVWVHQGLSDQTIKNRVVASFGTDELLQQTNPLYWLIPSIVVGLGLASLVIYLVRRRNLPISVSGDDEALVAEHLSQQGRQS